jgi:hypothetical protein
MDGGPLRVTPPGLTALKYGLEAIGRPVFSERYSLTAAIASCSFNATIADQMGAPCEVCSISLRASMETRPVLNETKTASRAAGMSSEMVWEVLMAAAAKEPVQRPIA